MHWTRRQRKTYEAKGRPSDNPLIVHIADLEDLSEITENVPPETELLAKHFWPGPLTMIFEKVLWFHMARQAVWIPLL